MTKSSAARKPTTARSHGAAALDFLEHHRLDPVPVHYELAYIYVTTPDSRLAGEVAQLTDGGFRLSSIDALTILDRHRSSGAQGDDDDQVDDRYAVAHQALRLADIAAGARSATNTFSQDLAEFSFGGTPLASIATEMIKRAESAEADLASTAAELDRLRAELTAAKGDANRDALTDLANRRALEPILDGLKDDDKGYAIALCDVDHFKRINDQFGHPVGDNVLRALAATLRDSCTDHHVARWGGEEFMIVMPGTSLAAATACVDKARVAMEARDLKLRGSGESIGTITFSAGVAFGRGEPASAVIDRADGLSYEAKRAGRNRVCAR